jgi:cyclic beta-1,2-glucan synthetase
LLAWRRARSPDEDTLWLVHALVPAAGSAGGAGGLEHGSDRVAFIGRGRTLRDPRALDAGARLSGTVGSVLDAALGLRRTVTLEPGASASLDAVLGVAADRAGAEELAGRVADPDSLASLVDGPAGGTGSTLPLPPGWAAQLDRLPEAGPGVASPGAPHPPPRPTDADPASPPPHSPPPHAHDDPAASPPHPRIVDAHEDGEEGGDTVDAAGSDEELAFFNGYGGFTPGGDEYVVRIDPGSAGPSRPPQPWVNVVANPRVGFIVSEAGAMHTWCGNSRLDRLSPWPNDPVVDPPGEALWVRDETTGSFWSPTAGPSPGPGVHEARHGLGYTLHRYRGRGLAHETCSFVPRDDPVRIVRLTLRNEGDAPRALSAWSYVHWVLGELPVETRGHVVTEWDEAAGAVLARNPDRAVEPWRVAFAAALPERRAGRVDATGDRAAFLGVYGDPSRPAALVAPGAPAPRFGAGLDPCAAFRVPLELAPGQEVQVSFLLGEAADAAGARDLIERYRDPGAVERALDEVRAFWRDLVGGIRIDTPAPALDVLANGWLAYQTLGCRMWARTAFYQSSGAYGFRDQLQDSAALVWLAPHLTRTQILRHAAHQFVEGDVLHWWHPPTSEGIRTRFSDDLLWLPRVTAQYVAATGDAAVLDEQVPFVTGPALPRGEDEIHVTPGRSGEEGSVYEHGCRALDRSLTRGAHGLPLMGTGDWNDGMNRVGRKGRGESVWLGFFLLDVLDDFLPLCERRGDEERAGRYLAYRTELALALDDAGWDGAWYRRAYYDDGSPLGSASSDECRIDAIAQAWSVISGVAPPERAASALDAMEAHLVSEKEGLIRLLAPPFDRTPRDPGYIKGYLPGVRENGGQYTHGALWAVRALAEAGRHETAARLLEMLSPVAHARTPEEVAVYQVEPYVVAADVYGVEPHTGRGGWTWYTGSSGWMLRVLVETLLGVQLVDGTALHVRPRIPPSWPGFGFRYRLPDGAATYQIEVTRAADGPPISGWCDGDELERADEGIRVPLVRDGRQHQVRVVLGGEGPGS